MEISQKDFNEIAKVLSSMTKTIKNFDERLKEVENNVEQVTETVEDVAETVTVELPKAIAETVAQATEAAIGGEPEVCPECGKEVCECEAPADANAEAPVDEVAVEEGSLEEFSEKVTETIEGLANIVNEISSKVEKMFIKVFSEIDEDDVTEDVSDLQKVEKGLKEDPKEVVTEEEDVICDECAEKAKVVVEKEITLPVSEPTIPAPVSSEPVEGNFSERYQKVKAIFNL